MTLHEAEQEIASRPVHLAVIEGCVLIQDGLTPQPWTIARHLQHHSGDETQVERLVNRRFVVAHLLDPVMERPLGSVFGMTSEVCRSIAQVAESYAASLHDALRREFPARRFEVEVIGADYVEDEPLEVCVTLSQAR